jgi:hypothetical protein
MEKQPFVAHKSPQKRRFLQLSGHPEPILQKKRRQVSPLPLSDDLTGKISLTGSLPSASLQETMLYTMNADPRTGSAPDNPSVAAIIQSSAAHSSTAPESLSIIEKESHSFRQQLQDSMTMDKGTEVAYSKHLKRYEEYWIDDQKRREAEAQATGGHWESTGPHPITATKVCVFLKYESTRNKVRT